MRLKRFSVALVALAALMLIESGRAEIDEEAALDLAKRSNCLKCHSIEVKKEGPPYREVAKKYRDKPDAEATLYKHVTTAPKVKIDGEEEDHQIVKSKKKPEILNLLRWILSQ